MDVLLFALVGADSCVQAIEELLVFRGVCFFLSGCLAGKKKLQ